MLANILFSLIFGFVFTFLILVLVGSFNRAFNLYPELKKENEQLKNGNKMLVQELESLQSKLYLGIKPIRQEPKRSKHYKRWSKRV